MYSVLHKQAINALFLCGNFSAVSVQRLCLYQNDKKQIIGIIIVYVYVHSICCPSVRPLCFVFYEIMWIAAGPSGRAV